jgi:DNA-directed RNA polymerase beta subunit
MSTLETLKSKRKYTKKVVETPITESVIEKPKRKYTRRNVKDDIINEPITSSSKLENNNEIVVVDNSNKYRYNWERGAWQILKLMMNEPKFLIQHQVSSFNEFLDKGIKNVIAQFNTITLNYDYVTKQKFYRIKNTSTYALQSDSQWTEYNDVSDIYQTFKDKYFIYSNKTITISLSDHNTATVEKERLLQSEFQSFIDEHIEYYNIDINKHRYDLEIDMVFHSLTPPTIFENNGSQKLMYPNDARIRNFTYASNLYIDVNFKTRERYGPGFINIKESQIKNISKVNCGKIPIMLGSKACILSSRNGNRMIDYEECEYDEGGYFIVNGTEKVIIGQERQAENKIYVFKNSKSQGKYSYICEVKSLPDKKVVTPKNIQVKITSKETIHGRNIKVSIPHIKQDLPLFVVFKALGIISDYDIVNMILYNIPKEEWREYTQFLLASLEEASTITTEIMAKEYMYKYVNMMGYDRDKTEKERRLTYLNDIIYNDFLPHVGCEYKAKAFYLGHMVKLLLDVFLKKRDPDDRDSYVNKRIDTAGILMANLFRQYFTKLVKDMKTNINKEYTSGSWRSSKDFESILNMSNIYKLIKYSTITTGLKFALATGNWGIKNNNNKQGIAQVLSRLTYNSTLSHLRRVNTPMEKTSKLVAPRKLHGTQMMYMCGAETPEGGSVGVVKNLALSCHITSYSDINPIIDILKTLDTKSIIDTVPDDMYGQSQIFINGNWLFITQYPKKIYDTLIHLRRTGIIHVHTSIIWKITDNIIEIYSDAGRCTRPLYILDSTGQFRISNDMVKKIVKGELNWNNLLVGTLHARNSNISDITEGVIEFVDVQEQDNCMIAVTNNRIEENGTKTIYYNYTHCEIHPAFIQGVLASIIPFSDHNQSPRNCYQCLDIHETVLMADGSRKEIKDVIVGDEVVTFNPDTMNTSITKVIHQYIRPTENKIYRIKTVSGREIIATGNHNFMTTDGWKSVENMNNETMIGIYIGDGNIRDNEINIKIVRKAKCIFVPIQSITEVENRLISDITVESDNHSFIAGKDNFLSSNSAMGKQAMGIYATNFRYRMDTVAHLLRYPQLPLVNSRVIKYLPSNDLPSGINVVVAIASFSGYNQEDSIIMNYSACQRGLFISDHYHTYKDEEKKRQSTSIKMQEKFAKPNTKNTLGTRGNNYETLTPEGFPVENIYVRANDAIIGKVHPIHSKTDDQEMYRCCSTIVNEGEEGFIDKVMVSRNGDGYRFAKIRIRNSRIPTVGDKHACYTPDHEVLTTNGWINIADITLNHKVASIIDNSLSYTNPLEIMSYDYNGELYKVKSNQVDLLVTPNHRMYVGNRNGNNYNFKEASTIYGKRLKYKKNIDDIIIPDEKHTKLSYNEINTNEEMKTPQGFILNNNTILPIKDWLIFFGIWIAEGCVSNKVILFAAHKQRVKNALDEICNNMGLQISKKKENTNDIEYNRWCINHKELVSYMEPYSVGAINKYLPDWVWHLTKEQCRYLIDGMMLGDGHTMSNGTRRYDTSSKKLADDFQRLCLHAGYSTNIAVKYEAGHTAICSKPGREGEIFKSTVDAYRLTIIEKQNNPIVNKNIKLNGDNRQDKLINYNGKVYCCRVNGIGAIYVRRNGIPVWCGNSRHG